MDTQKQDEDATQSAQNDLAQEHAESATVQIVRPKEKRTIKLTAKGFLDKLEKLQKIRKFKLNKAANLRNTIQELIEKRNSPAEVQRVFDEFLCLCDDVKSVHNEVMEMLPDDEKEKHDIWFKAKMMFNEVLISDVKAVLGGSEIVNFNQNQEDFRNKNYIDPDDSVSNVSKRSSKCSSNYSTASSAKIQAEADRAALLEEARVLRERHAIEEQEQQLKRKKETLEIEAKLAATAAKIAVLESYENGSRVSANATNSYFKREQHKTTIDLNPKAEEFKPLIKDGAPENLNWSPPVIRKVYSMPPTVVPVTQLVQSNTENIPSQNDIYSILERQTEITASLVKQQRLLSLPARDVPRFDGDPLQYLSFCRAFEQSVEARATKGDCLYYLEQFTSGLPRELVRSCLHMDPESGFVRAKQLLKEHFGDEIRIATAYMEKVFSWPTIKAEDLDALQAYALFLRACCNVMMDLNYLKDLDVPTNMRAILVKLPYKLRERWRSVAYDIMDSTNQRATFKDLVTFLERHVKILSDPLFGSIHENSGSGGGARVGNRTRSQSNTVRGTSFATRVSSLSAENRGVAENGNPVCVFCSESHLLVDCLQFKGTSHNEKIHFLKNKGLCFGCLEAGHLRKDCDNVPTCNICGKFHHVILHIDKKGPVSSEQQGMASTSQTCGLTGAGRNDCFLPIVPVHVKSSRCDQVIGTYAFLDPGSSSTFCSESLMERLNVSGKKTNFVLQTMGQERVVSTHSLTGLEVSALDSNVFHELPDVFTQKRMPVKPDCAATNKDITRWPYLDEVKIPSISASVDLLIGSNAPKILEPLKVIQSKGNGPYAVKTVLGWIINGPSK